MATDDFSEYFRASLAHLGIELEPSAVARFHIPDSLPPALVAWYRLAGESALNSAHNRVLRPSDLQQHGLTTLAGIPQGCSAGSSDRRYTSPVRRVAKSVAGVCQPRVLRGRRLNSSATLLRSVAVYTRRSVLFGK